MMQGTYYKEWSRMLGREMEFKVYGTAGVPVLALPARGGRFYDWENNGMPEAVASLLSQRQTPALYRRRHRRREPLGGDARPAAGPRCRKVFQLPVHRAGRPHPGTEPDQERPAHLVRRRGHRCLSGRQLPPAPPGGVRRCHRPVRLYDMSRFLGSAEDDLVLRNAPSPT